MLVQGSDTEEEDKEARRPPETTDTARMREARSTDAWLVDRLNIFQVRDLPPLRRDQWLKRIHACFAVLLAGESSAQQWRVAADCEHTVFSSVSTKQEYTARAQALVDELERDIQEAQQAETGHNAKQEVSHLGAA